MLTLGFASAILPDLSLAEVLAFAAQADYDCVEVMCWPRGQAERRYAGVTHIDVTDFGPAQAAQVHDLIQQHGVAISALGYYPNPLTPDRAERQVYVNHIRAVIDAAQQLGLQNVNTFVGRDQHATVDANWLAFLEVWPPLVRHAAGHGVKIAIENCPMLFSYDEWPGGTNLAYSPALWRQLFEIVPDANFGLNFDPSHLVWQFIDYERAIYDFGDRIFHVHAKDMEVNRDGLYEHGVLSQGMGWQVPRLPGLGEVRWNRFMAALYAVGYDFVVSVEHEDRGFEGDEQLVKRGFEIAYRALRPYVA
jgi:sugar phosphate isomerase/epimerase